MALSAHESHTGRLAGDARGNHTGRAIGAARGREAQRAQRVDVEPLRAALMASEVSLSELARRLGWYHPDAGRVGRVLGMHRKTTNSHTGERGRQVSCEYRTAVRIARAIGVDPVDVGL